MDKSNLGTFFETEGRYSLLALAAYFLMTIGVNWFYFRVPVMRLWTAVDLPWWRLRSAAFWRHPGGSE